MFSNRDKRVCGMICSNAKKRNTLVSGNAGDEKNVHPGGREFTFLVNLFVERQRVLPFIVQREKAASIRTNKFNIGKPS